MNAELIARLEAAEVVNCDLEVRFATHLYNHQETFKGLVNSDPELWVTRHPSPLSSLDAAIALAERVLPECRCIVEHDHDGTGWACVRAAENTDRIMNEASTPSLALCIAILRALDAKQEGA